MAGTKPFERVRGTGNKRGHEPDTVGDPGEPIQRGTQVDLDGQELDESGIIYCGQCLQDIRARKWGYHVDTYHFGVDPRKVEA